jgi:Flp pilus assembly protein TadG
LGRLKALRHDIAGAGAIEFAFLAPVLIALYVSSFEITTGYTAARNILKGAATVADIVTRQPSVDKAFLSEMLDTAEATIAPHSSSGMTLKITGITIDSAGNPSVLWSWDQDGNAPYSVGSTVDVPSDMRIPSSFLVHAEFSVPHTMLMFLGSGASFASETRTVTITREFYYRQRLSDDIVCSDCS